ncbi:MAG: ATP-binding protein [Desulfovibrionaceae bacterium]
MHLVPPDTPRRAAQSPLAARVGHTTRAAMQTPRARMVAALLWLLAATAVVTTLAVVPPLAASTMLSAASATAEAATSPPPGDAFASDQGQATSGDVHKPKRTVLYLNSYHNGYSWSDSILEGIRAALNAGKFRIDLQIEYMDTKKYPYAATKEILFSLYRDKFRNERFDVVLVSDNAAYEFARAYRNILFPGVPVVFCGVNDLDPTRFNEPLMTGAIENFDAKESFDIAFRFHPERRKVVIIGDTSPTDTAILNQIRQVLPALTDRATFEMWTKYDLMEIIRRVRGHAHDTIFYVMPFYQNVGGVLYTAEDVVEEIYKRAGAPLYSGWEFLVNHGIVGGRLISGVDHGRTAANMALRILDGESPENIPIVPQTGSSLIFDWNVMQKFGIGKEQLPEGSRIINEPPAFYELDKEVFWTIMAGLVFLLMFLAFLILHLIQRRTVEKKIKNQLSFQEILMDTIPQLICWKDTRQRYLGANRTFTQFFGIASPAEIMHKTDIQLMAGAALAQWLDALDREVLESGQPRRREQWSGADASGATVWLEITKVPLQNEAGETVGTLSTAEDVTGKVMLEKQLLQSQKMEAIGTLAGGIAHDFNNILTSVINSTELALLDVPDGSPMAADLQRVLRASQRGSRLVKQILAFSKPSQEGFLPTDVAVILREVLGLIRPSLPGEIEVREDIRASGHCVADPTQIHQIIMNLCTNAFQAMRDDGGVLTLGLEETLCDEEQAQLLNLVPGPYLRITITDTGPGISPDIADKIFDPFFTTKGKAEGTGLGFAVAHGIVRAHKGAIAFSSVPGEHTSFHIYLPGIAVAIAEPLSCEYVPCAGTEHILFVEDDQDQLNSVPRALARLGYTVTPRASVDEAMHTFSSDPTRFDLILTDFDMPGKNGLELARRIAAVAPDMPVVMVSGRSRAMSAHLESGNIRRTVLKPYSRNTLARAIRDVLDGRPEEDNAPHPDN